MIKMKMPEFVAACKRDLSFYLDIQFIKPENPNEVHLSFSIKNIDLRSLPIHWRNIKTKGVSIDKQVIENVLFEMAEKEHVIIEGHETNTNKDELIRQACALALEDFIKEKRDWQSGQEG